VIQCGDARIMMTKNGQIQIEGVKISEDAKEYLLMTAKKIDLNP
jgi:hypothetical protein